MNEENKALYFYLITGQWQYISDTAIATPSHIACDLNHPNIKTIFDRAMIDVEEIKKIHEKGIEYLTTVLGG